MKNSDSPTKYNQKFLFIAVPLFLFYIVLDVSSLSLFWKIAIAEKEELNRGRQAVAIDPMMSRDGDIVTISGDLTGGEVVDPLTGFSFNTPLLKRVLYRWERVKRTSGGGDGRREYYEWEWVAVSKEVYESSMQINGYHVDKGLVESGLYKPQIIDNMGDPVELSEAYKGKILVLKNNVAYLVEEGQKSRRRGDIRFGYFSVPPVAVTLVGILSGNEIKPLNTPTGSLRAEGYKDVDSIIDHHVFLLGWILFAVTFYFAFIVAVTVILFYFLLKATSIKEGMDLRYWRFFAITTVVMFVLSRFGASVEEIENVIGNGVGDFFWGSLALLFISFVAMAVAFNVGTFRK